jgi:rfaE bifunctional protein nucleotidyltransferase chain/domain
MKENLVKIKTIDFLEKFINIKKKEKKKIVLCHGAFDVLHVGHLNYLKSAKKNGDVLIVSVTSAKYIKKGPNRPINNDIDRLTALSFIDIVDFIVLDKNETAENIISKIKPNFFVKGPDYKKKKDQNLKKEIKITKKFGGKLVFTSDQLYSSSRVINEIGKSDLLKKKINHIKKNFNENEINNLFLKFKNLKVLLIGETIEDEYIYTDYLGKPSKENIIATVHKSQTNDFGGVFGTYKALKSLDLNIDCLTVINKNKKKLLKSIDKKLIHSDTVISSDRENIIKTRFINKSHYKINKLFEIYNYQNLIIEKKVKRKILSFLKNKINSYDIIIVNDYGHGFIDNDILNKIVKTKKFLCVNTQINAGNFGFNLITKYKKANFICLNRNEAQTAAKDNSTNYDDIIKKLKKSVTCDTWCITLGSDGSLIKYKNQKHFKLNAISNQVLDTISAGDMFFAIASVFWFTSRSTKFSLLIASLAGIIAANIETPGAFVNKEMFKKQIENLLK